MPKRLWIAVLSVWPGLAQIWSGRDVVGLMMAIAFAAALNLALISRYIWTEAFPPGWTGFFAVLADWSRSERAIPANDNESADGSSASAVEDTALSAGGGAPDHG